MRRVNTVHLLFLYREEGTTPIKKTGAYLNCYMSMEELIIQVISGILVWACTGLIRLAYQKIAYLCSMAIPRQEWIQSEKQFKRAVDLAEAYEIDQILGEDEPNPNVVIQQPKVKDSKIKRAAKWLGKNWLKVIQALVLILTVEEWKFHTLLDIIARVMT